MTVARPSDERANKRAELWRKTVEYVKKACPDADEEAVQLTAERVYEEMKFLTEPPNV